MPQTESAAWSGTLTGGYCVVNVQAATPRQAARSSRGKSLTLFLYESEEAYQHFLQMSKQAKAENLSEVQQHK